MINSVKVAQTSDGSRIAFDVTGNGSPLFLIHGSGQTRQNWHQKGYTQKFQEKFTVFSIDLPGVGDSDGLVDNEYLSIETICSSIVAVADSCQVDTFSILGYSLGGYIARFMGGRIDRIKSIVMLGAPFGPPVTDEFDQYIDTFIAKYGPMAGTPPKGEQSSASIKKQIPTLITYFKSMRNWPTITPDEIRCPALMILGDKNKPVYRWVIDNQIKLDETQIRAVILKGLTHPQEFDRIDMVFPLVHDFLMEKEQLAISVK